MSESGSDTPPDTPARAADGGVQGSRRALVLGAVGVVFGDLGTSPLYTMKEAFSGSFGMPVNDLNVLGVISLLTWTLVMVVAVKYATFMMRADNNGEGGVMAMMALARSATGHSRALRRFVVLAAVLGAALFYGDGVITPSITVLSSMEGLQVAAPQFAHFVLPLTVLVLVGLFWSQRKGTGKVGSVFGPVMCLWFACIGSIGIWNIIQDPAVLRALNPWYAVNFFLHHHWGGFVILGAVVLCVTGAEALYTDLGHFGRSPIRVGWFGFVMPGCLLNYYGQAANLLSDPAAAVNPFYHAVPQWALYPMIGLATVAAVIASQSVISGAFSMTRQAIHLGFLPHMRVVHTSTDAAGQIYVPWINWTLLILVLVVVIGFGSSNALAGAYGIAVTGTMAIDSILFMIVARYLWKWGLWRVLMLGLVFLAIDMCFFGANTLKIPEGGWLPLVLGLAVFTIMTTWRRGRELLKRSIRDDSTELAGFIKSIGTSLPHRVPGTALFFTANPAHVPHALLHNVKHNKVLHERNVLLKVETLETPIAAAHERFEWHDRGGGFQTLVFRFGFAEESNVLQRLETCSALDPPFKEETSTFFISREMVVPRQDHQGMALWRDKLFTFMARNALPATAYFNIPGNRLVELGAQVKI